MLEFPGLSYLLQAIAMLEYSMDDAYSVISCLLQANVVLEYSMDDADALFVTGQCCVRVQYG